MRGSLQSKEHDLSMRFEAEVAESGQQGWVCLRRDREAEAYQHGYRRVLRGLRV